MLSGVVIHHHFFSRPCHNHRHILCVCVCGGVNKVNCDNNSFFKFHYSDLIVLNSLNLDY